MTTARHPLSLDAVFSLPALWAAADRAARGQRFSPSVAKFRVGLERHLVDLRAALLDGSWRPSPVRTMTVRDLKPRVISVPPFRDRVVHQAVAAVLEPRHRRRMIADNYACVTGRRTHAALHRASAWARTWRWYVHLDVARYFPSIDHETVRAQLHRDLPDVPLRGVCERILDAGGTTGGAHFPGDDLFAPAARRVGLPLGSLLSQLFANRYLDPVDHLVKDQLRLRGYLRYMDDMLLLHDDREVLAELVARVEAACNGLRLRLHPWSVQPTRGGVGFVGFNIKPDHVRIRRTSVTRAIRRLRFHLRHVGGMEDEGFRASLRATFAHWSHADSWRLRNNVLRELGVNAE